MADEVLATVKASPARRWMGVGVLLGVGALMIYVALASPPALGWQVFLVITGVVMLWVAERMRQATALQIELTKTELRDSSGTCLAQVADIQAIDRGFFAFKPSNGFLVKTRAASGRAWNPGLWWRMGRRIGVGGVTPASQTKVMSEMLAAMLAVRDQDSQDIQQT